MIVMSSKKYLPTSINTIVLSQKESYFYVHRNVYDKALILSENDLMESLRAIIDTENNRDTIHWFYEEAPKPLNILAPFLGLIEGEIEQDMAVCCGVLHAITMAIDVKKFISFPEELRQCITFTLSIKEEYQMAWEAFFMTCIPASSIENVGKINETIHPDWKPITRDLYFNDATGEAIVKDKADEPFDDTCSIVKNDSIVLQHQEEKNEIKKLLEI